MPGYVCLPCLCALLRRLVASPPLRVLSLAPPLPSPLSLVPSLDPLSGAVCVRGGGLRGLRHGSGVSGGGRQGAHAAERQGSGLHAGGRHRLPLAVCGHCTGDKPGGLVRQGASHRPHLPSGKGSAAPIFIHAGSCCAVLCCARWLTLLGVVIIESHQAMGLPWSPAVSSFLGRDAH